VTEQVAPGVLRASWVPSIANIAAPTVAEINAGVDLTVKLRRDGVSTPLDGKAADNSDISSPYDKTVAATFGGAPISLKLKRDPSAETIWTTLTPPSGSAAGASGFVVIRRFGGSAVAFASTQKVEVWPVQVLSRAMDNTTADNIQTYTAMLAVPSAPNQDAVIA
jgi:hypothetical protein